jgi:hypothetical protein
VEAVSQDLGGTARAGRGDDRQTAGERFEKDVRIPFEARRQDEEACLPQRLDAVFGETRKLDPIRISTLGSQAFQEGSVGPLPVNNEMPIDMPACQTSEAPNQDIESLLRGEPSEGDKKANATLVAVKPPRCQLNRVGNNVDGNAKVSLCPTGDFFGLNY